MPPKSPQNEEAGAGAAKKVLVGVRVPMSFHQRIQSECIRRDQSLQQVVVNALKLYFAAPSDFENMTVTFIPHGQKGAPLPDGVAEQRDAWMDIWLRYIHSMPPEKIEVLAKAMEWDLQAQKSSRRKSVRRPTPAAGKRE